MRLRVKDALAYIRAARGLGWSRRDINAFLLARIHQEPRRA